jgi:hypothetical protein
MHLSFPPSTKIFFSVLQFSVSTSRYTYEAIISAQFYLLLATLWSLAFNYFLSGLTIFMSKLPLNSIPTHLSFILQTIKIYIRGIFN